MASTDCESMAIQVASNLNGRGFSCEILEDGVTIDVGLMVLLQDKKTNKNGFERMSVIRAEIQSVDLTSSIEDVSKSIADEINRYAKPFNMDEYMDENGLSSFEDLKEEFDSFMDGNGPESSVNISGEIRMKPAISTMLWMLHSSAVAEVRQAIAKKTISNKPPAYIRGR